MLAVTGIIVYFAGGVIGVLLSNGQIGAERDLMNWVNDYIVPFPFYNTYIRFHPGLKLFCIILAAVFSDQCSRREYRTNKSLGIRPGIFLLCGTVCACGNRTNIRNQCSGFKQFFQRGNKFLDNEDHSVFIKAASVCESPVFYKYLDYGDYHKLLNIQVLL